MLSGEIFQRLPIFSTKLPTCKDRCQLTLFGQYLLSAKKEQILFTVRFSFRRIPLNVRGISAKINCRIPCHFDCVTENCGYAVRGRRNEINSKFQTILEAGYAVRGTWNEINSKSQTILEAGYAVRGTRNEINSKSETILEAGYPVHGTRKEMNSKCKSRLEAGYAVCGTRKEMNSKSKAVLEVKEGQWKYGLIMAKERSILHV